MAAQCEGGCKDEIKSQFGTREGCYKVMTFSEYRPNRSSGCIAAQTNHPVKVSFITLPEPNSASSGSGAAGVVSGTGSGSVNGSNGGSSSVTANANNTAGLNAASACSNSTGGGDRICFNVGRELYFYMYKGLKKAADLTKPIDKRVYKGTYPTCHDFNEHTVSSKGVSLLVGFSAGQIQLIDPIKKELSKLYNDERLIDKSKVTCLKWLPNSPNQFLVAHGSGQMYVYNEELPCGTTPPHYQLFKQGEGFTVYTCKTKSTRNPLYRWVIGEGAINEFAFSPCCKYVAVASQDGFLRVYNYDTMDVVGLARSYFGGLLCVCWSPDGKYVVTGGEDDLVTVWSFNERRVVARGHGHKSWVSVVAFDAYNTFYEDSKQQQQQQHTAACNGRCGGSGGTDEESDGGVPESVEKRTRLVNGLTCYRFGSVGQDTQLCLWDLTEDVLKQPPLGRSRTSNCCNVSMSNHSKDSITPPQSNCVAAANAACATVNLEHSSAMADGSVSTNKKNNSASSLVAVPVEKEHKRNFSLSSRNSSGDSKNSVKSNSVVKSSGGASSGGAAASASGGCEDAVRLIGTSSCPRLDEVCLLEPLVCKKIAHERLTSLVFRRDSMVTACQEGFVLTWARPGRANGAATALAPNAAALVPLHASVDGDDVT